MQRKQLTVPYHSQFLEVEDHFWNIRSCGGTCIKMCLDYFGVESPNILAIMNEAFTNGGYDINNGFVHDFAVVYFKKMGLESYRSEKMESVDTIVEAIDAGNPVMVSITKRTLEQKKFHLILVVGYEKDDEGKVKTIIYHEPESTSPERGAHRTCDVDTFMDNWRGMAVFVSQSV